MACQKGVSLLSLLVVIAAVVAISLPMMSLANYWQSRSDLANIGYQIDVYMDAMYAEYRSHCVAGDWDLSMPGLIESQLLSEDASDWSLSSLPLNTYIDSPGQQNARVILEVSGLTARQVTSLSTHSKVLRVNGTEITFQRHAGPLNRQDSSSYIMHRSIWDSTSC